MADLLKASSEIVQKVGGVENISLCINCMTRLRITIKDMSKVDKAGLEKIENVLMVVPGNPLQIVVGPGKAQKMCTMIQEMLPKKSDEETKDTNLDISSDWKDNKAKVAEKRKFKKAAGAMKRLANIFTPLIPAIIAAGLFAAIASIIKQVGGYTITEMVDWTATVKWVPYSKGIDVLYNICIAFSSGFTSYIVIFVGINAAKEFKATPMLGGFLGGICSIGNITTIAKIIGLYNVENELASTLLSGKGGVIGVILACYLLGLVERFLHKKLPNALDTVFVPFLSILIVGSIYVFGIMILAGYISDGICYVIGTLTMSNYIGVRIFIGFVAAALFLPLVMTGMHHGLVAFYATELMAHHYVSLYPVLAMAGAGQVGAAIAIYIKAKKRNNKILQRNVASSIVPGVLGVGEPLIYSVTLPLFVPFITAGIGAGIGGAFLMAFRVGSTAWGPSGFLAIPLMTFMNGQENMLGMGIYTIGLFISIGFGFLFTWLIVKNKRVEPVEIK